MKNISEKIDSYFLLAEEIHKYFGYEEDWVVIPMDDQRDNYWMVDEGESNWWVYSPQPFTKESIAKGREIYSGVVYTQRFLKKWVYRGEELTIVCADTQTDGNKFLMIFQNNKECTDKKMKQTFQNNW